MKEKLVELIKEITFTEINTDEKLIENNILDSITIVELSVAIENEFKIKIPFNEINKENFETLDSIEQLINRKLN